MQRMIERFYRLWGLLGLAALCSAAVATIVALRYILATPQPLESILPGEARIYRWKRGHIFYRVLGAQDAPPLVLLHAPGVGASAYEMRKIMEPLALHYRVYAPDLLGFGLSDRPRMDYTAETYSSLCHDFLTEVVTQPATLLASGLSCNYAVDIAASSPDLCKQLVLVSPTALFSAAQIRKQDLLTALVPLLLQYPAVGFVFYSFLSTRSALRYALKRQGSSYAVAELDHLYATTHQLGAHHAPMALLAGKLAKDVPFEKLQQPVLIIWGTHTLNKVRSITSQQQLSQGTQVTLIHDTGTQVHQEQPAKVVANIQEWSETVTTSELATQAVVASKEEASPLAAASGVHESEAAVASEEEVSPVVAASGVHESEAVVASEEEVSPMAAASEVHESEAVVASREEVSPMAAANGVHENEAAVASTSASETSDTAVATIVVAQMSETEGTNMSTTEAYCVKCKTKRVMQHPHQVTMKNGRPALQGTCSTCGTGLFRIGGTHDEQEASVASKPATQAAAATSKPATQTAVASKPATQTAVAGEPVVEAYCVKCKTKRMMQHPHKVTMKNGRPALQGTCPTCGTGLFRIGAV